jgi:RHS repeat-associated protein
VNTITVSNSGGTVASFAYSYDDALNVDTLTDADGLHDYNYDGLNRLMQATHPAGSGLPTSESFDYDRVGNREEPGNAAAYSYDNNHRITNSTGLSYGFDADGSLATRSDGAAFTHDVRNRLTQYSKSGVISSYVQDFFGRRIKKTVGSTTTYFLWDGMRLLSEHNGSGVREKRYGYGSAGYAPWQLQDAAGTYWAHADRLEQPRLLTSSTGQVVWKATAAAYGSTVVQSDPDGNGTAIILNTRLPGQYWDGESGLHYNYFRDYDPQLGRYVQADPIGLAGGVNPYSYVFSNPLNFIDPYGLNADSFVGDAWIHVGVSIVLGAAVVVGSVPLGAAAVVVEVGVLAHEGYKIYNEYNEILREEQQQRDEVIDGQCH